MITDCGKYIARNTFYAVNGPDTIKGWRNSKNELNINVSVLTNAK